MYAQINGEIARSPQFYAQLTGVYALLDVTGKVYIGLAALLNACTGSKLLYLRWRKMKVSGSQEIGLFVMAFATFICQIMCQFVVTQIKGIDPRYSNIVSSVNADLFALSEVYIGLIFNRPLRTQLREAVCGKKPQSNVATISIRVHSIYP
ncbi:unnamed protein product, partial [Mesorhabditis spiculigera]